MTSAPGTGSPGSGQPLDDDLEREIAEALGDTSLLGVGGPSHVKARSRDALERLLDGLDVPGGAGGTEPTLSAGGP